MDRSFLNFRQDASIVEFHQKLDSVFSEDEKFVEGETTKAATGAHNPNPATEYTQMKPDNAFASIKVTDTTPDELKGKNETTPKFFKE
jgi:hypothetical protein